MKEGLKNYSQLKNTRHMFPDSKEGSILWRRAVHLRNSKELIALREEFGNSEDGEKGFQLIAVGANCDVVMRGKGGKVVPCTNVGITTIDYRSLHSHETSVACCEEHATRLEIDTMLAAVDRRYTTGDETENPILGRNGFRRWEQSSRA